MRGVRRALPSFAAALLIAGLLAAAVMAAPSDPADASARPSGPFALMANRPVGLEPRLSRVDGDQPATPAPPLEPIDELAPDQPPTPSRAVGKPWAGRLVNGLQMPASGVGFYTFDSALRRSPSRGWRRWGTDLTVARTTAVLAQFHAAHPDGPRLGVGDLSRTHGGPFGAEYGGLGHASHQNGQDVDVYYPRRDRRELPPAKPSEVDRALAQELVDRFVAAGADMAFVGPHVGLHGTRGVVQELAHHDDHVHVRWPKG
jgi:hypothetical protein